MFKIVKRADGTLETADASTDLTEAELREQIAQERAELRQMLEGNVAFHDDPMAAGKVEEPVADDGNLDHGTDAAAYALQAYAAIAEKHKQGLISSMQAVQKSAAPAWHE